MNKENLRNNMNKQFWVAQLLNDKTPIITNITFYETEKEAIDFLVGCAIEQGATEHEIDIRSEAEQDGFYRPTKFSEWAIQWGQTI